MVKSEVPAVVSSQNTTCSTEATSAAATSISSAPTVHREEDADHTTTTTTTHGPIPGHERTARLWKVLPEEHALWKTLHYFPYSATWDEQRQRQNAVQETQAKFVKEYTDWYVQKEISNLRQSVIVEAVKPGMPSSNHRHYQQHNNNNNNNKYHNGAAHNKNKHKRKRPNKKRQRCVDPDDDDDDVYQDEEQHQDQDAYAQIVTQNHLKDLDGTKKNLREAATNQLQPYLDFLMALPECEPLTAGFLLLPGSSQECCFCPCSYRLDAWRRNRLWRTGSPPHAFRSCGQSNTAKSVFRAPGLVAHVSNFKNNNNDWWHWLAHEYLQRLFQNYMGPNRPHKVFLETNSKEVSVNKYSKSNMPTGLFGLAHRRYPWHALFLVTSTRPRNAWSFQQLGLTFRG